MKPIDIHFGDNCQTTRAALKPLLNELIKTLILPAVQKRSFIVNDIPQDFNFYADTNRVSLVLSGLLKTFIMYTEDTCIRISAEKLYGNMIQVNVKDNDCNNTYALACALQKTVPLAEKIGGHLNITNQRQRITTISFIFPIAEQDQVSLTSLKGAA
jgi:hypothetical protein